MNDPTGFDQLSRSFLDWFRAQPGTAFHPSLQINDFRSRGAGRGIIATADIPAETDIFTIPRSAIISVETSELAKKLPELFNLSSADNLEPENETAEQDFDSSPADLPTPWLNLILILLHESFHHDSSKWSPYLSILPSTSNVFDTLMFWSSSELSELQASAIPSKIGKDSADRMFRNLILPVVHKYAEVFYPSSTPQLSDDELLQRCHIIGSLIMSYAFDLQPDNEPSDCEDEVENDDEHGDGWAEDKPTQGVMGMVPMADMLNADAEFNAHLSHGDDALTMTTLRTIKAGEEVLNYYGPLPQGELLRRYGYTSQKHARYDVVEVPWGLVREAVLEEFDGTQGDVEKALRKVEEDLADEDGLQDGFVLERDAGDPDEEGRCTVEAKFNKFPEEMVEVVSEIVTQLLKSDSAKRRMADDEKKRILKKWILSIFQRTVEKRSAQYATTIVQDEELLGSRTAKGRIKMAIEVRLGEKRLLCEAIEWTREMLSKCANPPTTADGSTQSNSRPPQKKQKKGR